MSDIFSVDPKFWDCPSLSSDEHISATLGEPIELPEDTDWASWASECEDELLAHFKELTGEVYSFQTNDNTYNSDLILSLISLLLRPVQQVITFIATMFSSLLISIVAEM
jgi:hypothetical protein